MPDVTSPWSRIRLPSCQNVPWQATICCGTGLEQAPGAACGAESGDRVGGRATANPPEASGWEIAVCQLLIEDLLHHRARFSIYHDDLRLEAARIGISEKVIDDLVYNNRDALWIAGQSPSAKN